MRSVKKDIHEVNASGDSGHCENSKSEFLPCVFPPIFLLLKVWFMFDILSFKHSKQELFRFVGPKKKLRGKTLSHLG